MKVGILTHYYKSENYGGNLQAYALCRFLNDKGYTAEQISYDVSKDHGFKMLLKKKLRNLWYCHSIAFAKNRDIRRKSIERFNLGEIPHSKVYNKNTVAQCGDAYDAFIVGSDQVWHPNAVCDAYLLDFVKEGKTKLSYAASFAVDELTPEQKQRYKKSLASFNGISVREEKAAELLSDITTQKVEWSVDPTLLLSAEQWDEACSPRLVEGDYIFCYFLGEDTLHRKLAEDFAKKNGLKLVTLPHLKGAFRECDSTFGDTQLYSVSPADFISLIKYAKHIFTDSFHASVFSLLYNKDFYVFERTGVKSMGSRLYSLTKLFAMEQRFCDTRDKLTMEYIEGLDLIDYNKPFELFEAQKEKSIAYLLENLK